MNRLHSQTDWIERARAVLPAAGFGNFDPGIVIARGEGARVWDEDGKEYVDYLIGSGPMLLGHGHPEVMEAVLEQLPLGLTFFANNARGIELAEAIVAAVPCCEQVRFVTSGGEADMYAIRLARAFTGKPKILKFEGGYHGMSAEAQMSLAPARQVNFPTPVPDSAGIPQGVADEMLIAPFNDLDAVASLLDEHDDVAAIIVEPLQRIIPARPGFLQGLRDLCDRRDILLIFDEIVTGFRLAYGGAQERYGVIPDICTLGKVIGGGFPLAALGASREIMAHFDKSAVGAEKWLMQLGTLSGNPVASAAGLKTLEILRRPGQYDRLRRLGQDLIGMQSEALSSAGVPHRICGDATLFDIYFTEAEPVDYRTARHRDPKLNDIWNAVLREHGVFKSPGKLYPSLAVTSRDREVTCRAIGQAATALAEYRTMHPRPSP
ncbi:aspartate aminotransferase family protein [Ovoidimarina sediminis]|uniref:aspartate aminotransferase family protein n=1 Tax=Ovoidimarina sediminis TaxID=3079856 RepID=UPI002910DE5E|nr:aminotransferase class III-fold pyridoxal phosphate-dependent enzyme [Rhodophyticola sp. MJ-SS7]MDU8945734.1 aminotransferase class III-fold pyridoxal phosphate-dependent enzyme [Rhodophyticola sp. MJ-SS7]